ncbi:MAG TPA: hypothetical protein VGX45_00440 [Solirubrobacteraceae bacterium]|nr:hypothetical protein [Solirubrobacteraceae bacterium]
MERDHALESEGTSTQSILPEQTRQLVAPHRVGQRTPRIFQITLARADKQIVKAVRRVGPDKAVMGE